MTDPQPTPAPASLPDIPPELIRQLAEAVRRDLAQFPPAPVAPQDKAVAQSSTLNGLVGTLRSVDPALAQQIEGTSAAGSRTIWMMLAMPLVTYFSVHFLAKNGMALDAETTNLVAGIVAAGLTALTGVLMRLITRTPIATVLPRPVYAPPNVTPPTTITTTTGPTA